LAANAVKSVSLRELAISAGAFGGLFVGGILMASVVNQLSLARFDSFVILFASACYVAVFVVAMRMKWQRSYSLFQAVSLTLANLSSPFLVLWGAVVAKEYGWIDLAGNDYTLSLLLLSGMALYLAVLMPIFQQRFRLLLAMPRG
jgi:hypothetical protein